MRIGLGKQSYRLGFRFGAGYRPWFFVASHSEILVPYDDRYFRSSPPFRHLCSQTPLETVKTVHLLFYDGQYTLWSVSPYDCYNNLKIKVKGSPFG